MTVPSQLFVADTSGRSRSQELRAFLKSSRSLISPERAGVSAVGRRRVPGLRREEVAALCGVSASWYTWFETGRARVRASPRFIEAVAKALQLDATHTIYLFSLATPEMPRVAAPVPDHLEITLARIAETLSHRPDAEIGVALRRCDAFAVGAYCTTSDGRLLYANLALTTLMGYDDHERYLRLSVPLDLYADSTERERWRHRIDLQGSARNVPTRARLANGSSIGVRDTAVSFRVGAEREPCYLGVWERELPA